LAGSSALNPRGRPERLGRLAAGAAIGLLSCWLLAYWQRSAPILPQWDGWHWIEQAKAFEEGGFSQLLREQHPFVYGQHIYLLPSLIALALGPLVDYSARPLALLSVLSLIACGLTFYRLARWSGVDRAGALAAFLAVASFRHWENMLLGFQLGLPLSVCLGSMALVVADARRSARGRWIAGALALGSALSSSGGLVVAAVLILVVGFDPSRRKRFLAIGAGIAILAAAVHFGLLALYDSSFLGDASDRYGLELWPTILAHGVLLLGGALVSGSAAGPAGWVLLAATLTVIVVQFRRTRRIDALSGLALWSLLAVFIIAGARLPFDAPASRHAIFAAPALGVCVIAVGRMLSTVAWARVPSNVALIAGCVGLTTYNTKDAVNYEWIISDADLQLRFYLLAQADGETLTQEELLNIYPFAPEPIRSVMQYTIDRHWMIFDGRDNAYESHHALPTQGANEATGNLVAGVLEFSGPGQLYTDYDCPYSTGCAMQVSAEVGTLGSANLGIILLDSTGVPYDNFNVVVPPSPDFKWVELRVRARAGSTLQPYVYASTAEDHVRIKSFVVRILPHSQPP
jgi:hypothetical protein